MRPGNDDEKNSLEQSVLIGANAIRDAYNNAAASDYEIGRRSALDFVNSYYKSPGFLRRIKTSIPKQFREQANNYDNFPFSTYTATLSPLQLNSISYTKDPQWKDNGAYDWNSHDIKIGEQRKDYNYDTTIAHELGHAVDNSINMFWTNEGENGKHKLPYSYSNYIPLLKQNYLYKSQLNYLQKHQPDKVDAWKSSPQMWRYDLFHDYMPGEQYGDLMSLRYYLNKLGIFDSRKKDAVFTKDMLEKLPDRENRPFNVNRMLDRFNQDDLVKIINEVANNKIKLNPRHV